MAKSRGRKFAELVAPSNGVFAAASIPTIALSKLASSAVTINSESLSLGGSLTLDTSDIGEHTSNKYFTDTRAQATLSVASNSGHGALAYDNSNGEFTFAGITTEAIQDVVGAMFSSNTETAVTVTYQDSDGTVDLIVDDTTKVPLAGGTMTGNLTLGDNVKAYFGASTDLQIYHDGTNSHIINSTGELRVTGSNIAIKSDSAKLYFGASDDLQIYHDGSHSFISDQGTGHLKLLAGNFRVNNSADNAQLISAESGGAVYLFHNNAVKLETTSTGVTVTGLTSMTTGVATSKFAVASTGVHGSYDFYNNGTSYFNGAVTVDDTLSANNVSILGTGILRVGTNQTWTVGVNPSSSIRLAYDGVERSITGHYTDGMSIRTNAHILRLATDGKVHFPAFTFPASDGTNGQVLQTNGSGVLSWSTAAGGGSVFSTSGSDAYYSAGNVGIGSSSVTHPLTVQDGANKTMILNRTASNEPANLNEFSSYYSLGIINRNAGSYLNFGGGSAGTKIQATDGAGSATAKYIALNPYGGYVGIGTGNTTPATPLHINSTADQKIVFSGSSNPYIRWQEGTANKGYMQWNAAGYFELRNEEVSSYWTLGNAFSLTPTTDEAFVIQRSGSALRQKIYNTSTTGTYSYLQLTTVNSSSAQDSGYIIKNAAQNGGNSLGNNSLYLWNGSAEVELVPAGTIGKRITLDTSGDLTVRGASTTGILGAAYSTNYFGLKTSGQTLSSEYMIISGGTDTYISATSGYPVYIRYGGNDSTNQLIVGTGTTGLSWRGSTVWTGENDGAGSGLDADTLDGVQAANFVRTDAASTVGNVNITFSGTPSSSNIVRFDNASGQSMNSATPYLSRLESRQATAGADAFMSFHVAGDYGAYFGLDGATNDFAVGGWSMGANKYKVWHAGNDGASSGLYAQHTNSILGTGGINGMVPGSHEVKYSGQTSNGTTGLFNAVNNANGILRLNTHPGNYFHDLGFSSDGSMYHRYFNNSNAFTTTAWNKVWTASNDGSGSGLDADLLDGNHASAFLDTSSTYQRKANGLQLGSASALTNSSSQLSLAGSNPYISFHHGTSTRTAYFQEASNRFYLGECTYTETEGSFRAPVFYDVNNTAYYSDQANVSRFNNIRPDIISTPGSGTATMFVFGKNTGSTDHINFSGSSADPSTVTNTVGLSWGTRSDGNGYYLIGVHNYNNSYSTHSRLRIGWHTGLELGGNATYGGVRIFEDSPFVNSTEQARFRGSGGIVFSRTFTDTVDIRTPIYYDSANTAYYLDPSASGTALKMSGSINMDATSWTGEIPGKIQYHSNQWYFQSAQGIFHFRNSSGTNLVYSDASGNVFNTVSTRSPIFYDSNNTGYYVDPASTTVLNNLTVNASVIMNDNQSFRQEGYFTTNTSGQNTNSSATHYSFGYQIAGAWSHPYPDLVIGYHTGMRFGGHTSYGGCRFYADHPKNSSTIIFSVGNGDSHVRATNNIYAYTSDKRLKENFRPIENAVDKVKSINGLIFDWRKDMMEKHDFIPDQEKDDAGLIAQEVQKIMPAAIRRAPFDHDLTAPNQSKSGEEFLTVQYEKMVPLLVEAIKEQQKQIDELKKLLEEKE